MQKSRLFLATLSHFCVDSYATLLAPLLPLVNERLGLSLALAGLLGTITSLCNLSQPLMGLWADRMSRRYLVVAGALLAALFSPLLGIAPNFLVLVLVLALAGLGVSAFHPQAFSLAGGLSGHRRSFGLALFIFGGTMGLGLTPLWAPYYVTRFGLENLPFVALPGLVTAFLLIKFIPLDNPGAHRSRSSSLWASLGPKALPLLLITLVVVLRSITAMGFAFYLTMLGKERGLSLMEGAIPLAVYNISGVVGSLIVGYLADRLDPRPLVWGSILLAAPALYGYVSADGAMGYLFLVAGGGLIMASNSVLVAMAQELSPDNSSLASSLPLGFSWGVASLTLPLIGYAADHLGVAQTLKYLSLSSLCPGVLALLLPRRP